MRVRFLALRKTFQAPSVYQENIQPAVIVIVIESHTATSGFEQIFVFVLAAEYGFCVQAGFLADVQEVDAELWRSGCGRCFLRGLWQWREYGEQGTDSGEQIFKR